MNENTQRNRKISYSLEEQNKSSSVVVIPEGFICPLTMEVMEYPLMSRHGNNFERKAILEWIARGNETCPMTRKTLKASDLVSNGALKTRIKAWKIRNNSSTTCWESDDDDEECTNCSAVLMPTSFEQMVGASQEDNNSIMVVSSRRMRRSSMWDLMRAPRRIESSRGGGGR